MVAVLLFLVTPIVQGYCDVEEEKARRKASLIDAGILDVSNMLEETLPNDSWIRKLKLTQHLFLPGELSPSLSNCIDTYQGKRLEQSTAGGLALGWLLEISARAEAEVLVIRDGLEEVASHNPDRYNLTGNLFVDWKERREIRVDSTIDFLADNLEIFFPESESRIPRLAISGPRWKVTEFGEEVIGLLKTARNESRLNQPYDVNSEENVLCVREGRIEIVGPPSDASPRERRREIELKVEECTDAIQVGPSYLELVDAVEEQDIGGDLFSEARRSVLFQTTDPSLDAKMFLWTTIEPVSRFDGMIAIESIAASLDNGSTIDWAFELADEQFVSGPYIFEKGGSLSVLSESDRPVGAILVFSESVVGD